LKTEFAALKKRTTKVHNERGAGRKPISDELKHKILEMRKKGTTYRKIANDFGLAKSTIHKVTKSNLN